MKAKIGNVVLDLDGIEHATFEQSEVDDKTCSVTVAFKNGTTKEFRNDDAKTLWAVLDPAAKTAPTP